MTIIVCADCGTRNDVNVESVGWRSGCRRCRTIFPYQVMITIRRLHDVASHLGSNLSAQEFHAFLQTAGQQEGSPLVLLDARRFYETRVGKFLAPGVETLLPTVRKFSELYSWIDRNSQQLMGNYILVYCTVGDRGQMAAGYIRSKGAGYEKVYQLHGGIRGYLEQFPHGGFFRGKNFVIDHRFSVGSFGDVMGVCVVCGTPYDDYSSDCCCSRTQCRMLVLVCEVCRLNVNEYMCELCQRGG